MKKELGQIVRQGLEDRIPVLIEARLAAHKPANGWLRAVRDSIGYSQQEIAKKLGMTRQAYADLETGEKRGSISLKSLDRAAEAMDCEFVYYVIPRKLGRTYGELAERRDPKFKHLQATEHSMALEDQAVGDLKSKSKPAE